MTQEHATVRLDSLPPEATDQPDATDRALRPDDTPEPVRAIAALAADAQSGLHTGDDPSPQRDESSETPETGTRGDDARGTDTDGDGDAVESEGNTDASTAMIEEFRPIVEALVFAADEPVPFRQIRDIVAGPPSDRDEATADDGDSPRSKRKRRARFTVNLCNAIIHSLNEEYAREGRAFRIVEIAGGFTFQTTAEFSPWVARLFSDRMRRRLTQSALETLAIIAFRQPISKPTIETIRGVNSDFVIKSLLERDLITIVGRDTTVGRPLLYGTTKTFLRHFGLRSLEDLPKPREIEELMGEEPSVGSRSIEEHDEPETSLESTLEFEGIGNHERRTPDPEKADLPLQVGSHEETTADAPGEEQGRQENGSGGMRRASMPETDEEVLSAVSPRETNHDGMHPAGYGADDARRDEDE
ncbi:MAG: SMC-Scp complex subunit ScpB [Bacteroidota bacterium]|nr:SMC-Scp complex subunit ScpB [Bacteroidota bacterium]